MKSYCNFSVKDGATSCLSKSAKQNLSNPNLEQQPRRHEIWKHFLKAWWDKLSTKMHSFKIFPTAAVTNEKPIHSFLLPEFRPEVSFSVHFRKDIKMQQKLGV